MMGFDVTTSGVSVEVTGPDGEGPSRALRSTGQSLLSRIIAATEELDSACVRLEQKLAGVLHQPELGHEMPSDAQTALDAALEKLQDRILGLHALINRIQNISGGD